MTTPTAPTPEPAAGTLATALAALDAWLAKLAEADRDDPPPFDQLEAAAWATVRAAAASSLEPKAPRPPPIDDISQRAARVMAAMAEAGQDALAAPDMESALGLGLAGVMHGVSMLGLGVQAIVGVGKAITGVTDSLEAIAATLDQANRMGWGPGQ